MNRADEPIARPTVRPGLLRSLTTRILLAFLAALVAMLGVLAFMVWQQRQVADSLAFVTRGYLPLATMERVIKAAPKHLVGFIFAEMESVDQHMRALVPDQRSHEANAERPIFSPGSSRGTQKPLLGPAHRFEPVVRNAHPCGMDAESDELVGNRSRGRNEQADRVEDMARPHQPLSNVVGRDRKPPRRPHRARGRVDQPRHPPPRGACGAAQNPGGPQGTAHTPDRRLRLKR